MALLPVGSGDTADAPLGSFDITPIQRVSGTSILPGKVEVPSP